MRRFFRQHLKKSPEHKNNNKHESVIAQLTQKLGNTPDWLRVESISQSSSNARIIQTRYFESEVDERRAIEGNTELARNMPLALPTTYQYPSLPNGHARFLRFMGLGPYPSASLESHALADPPPYIAISYCWDPSSPRRGIFLDSKSFNVSETVLEVLNQVQGSQYATGSPKVLLWIDQVCINQNDQSEKLDQIYRMSEIYSKAEKVFIWLGPTANESDIALEHIHRMLGEVIRLNDATRNRLDVAEGTIAEINEDHGHLYGHLFTRPWFRRLWTVQEALLGRNLLVMCGYREVNFDILFSLAMEILEYGPMDLFRVPGISEKDVDNAIVGIVNLYLTRPQNAPSQEMLEGLDMEKFIGLVRESRSRKVTMAADRVHALMGVSPRSVRESLAQVQTTHPNLSVWQLYAHFAKSMLESDHEWYFLSMAPTKERPRELPSWVSNLNSEPLFASFFAKSSCGFSAGQSNETRHLINRTVTTEELTAQGFRLDTVSEIAPQTVHTKENKNKKANDTYGETAREWEETCLRLCRRVYNLGPEQFPRFHVDILLAQPADKPAMDGRALDAYHIFWTGCRLRKECLQQINKMHSRLPEEIRHLRDPERLADHAFKTWRNGLSVEEYRLLLNISTAMKSNC